MGGGPWHLERQGLWQRLLALGTVPDPQAPLWLRLVPRLAWDHHRWDRLITRDATGFGVGASHCGLRWGLAGKIDEQRLSPETLEPCFPGPRNCSIPHCLVKWP